MIRRRLPASGAAVQQGAIRQSATDAQERLGGHQQPPRRPGPATDRQSQRRLGSLDAAADCAMPQTREQGADRGNRLRDRPTFR
jgi:hypothetical protein